MSMNEDTERIAARVYTHAFSREPVLELLPAYVAMTYDAGARTIRVPREMVEDGFVVVPPSGVIAYDFHDHVWVSIDWLRADKLRIAKQRRCAPSTTDHALEAARLQDFLRTCAERERDIALVEDRDAEIARLRRVIDRHKCEVNYSPLSMKVVRRAASALGVELHHMSNENIVDTLATALEALRSVPDPADSPDWVPRTLYEARVGALEAEAESLSRQLRSRAINTPLPAATRSKPVFRYLP